MISKMKISLTQKNVYIRSLITFKKLSRTFDEWRSQSSRNIPGSEVRKVSYKKNCMKEFSQRDRNNAHTSYRYR